jgi:integrase
LGKQGNGEGSITRHKKSVLYMARYTVETAISPKRKTIYGKTRAEVSEKLTNALSDRSKGLVFDTDNLTVAEYLQQWLDDSVRGSVMDVTFDSYSRLVKKHLTRWWG